MKSIKVIVIAICLILAGVLCVYAAQDVKPLVKSVEQAREGMTVWELIKSGGSLMYVLAVLSVFCVALVIYNFLFLRLNKISPRDFGEDVIKKLESGKMREVERMCMSEENIIAKIVMAGLDKKGKGPLFARESMENCAKKEVNTIWQNITYLSDIASIATLVGLLGTILGMIQSFNGIAFQTAVVKPMLIAAGVSKAMVTTAAGLIVAIPASAFYAYFKAKVNEISGIVDEYGSDIIKIIEGI